jgi:hypothetical protein
MKTKLKSWLVIALVFVAGFGAGVVVTRGVVRQFIRQAVTNPERVRELIEGRLDARLKLDEAQRQQVREILADSQKNIRRLRGEFAPRFTEIITNAESRVSEVLTPEQREKFAKLREENRKLWEPKGGL